MIKRLPPLKYRIAAFLIVNPLLALTANAIPVEAQEMMLNLCQMGGDSLHQLLGSFQPKPNVVARL